MPREPIDNPSSPAPLRRDADCDGVLLPPFAVVSEGSALKPDWLRVKLKTASK